MAELTLATVGAYLSEGAGKLLAHGSSNLGPDRLQKYTSLITRQADHLFGLHLLATTRTSAN